MLRSKRLFDEAGEGEGGGGSAGTERDLELDLLKKQVAGQGQAVGQLQQALREARAQPVQPARPAGAGPTKEELEKSFWANPLDMTAAIAQRAAQEAAGQAFQAGQAAMAPSIDTLIQAARDKARERDSEIFDRFGAEIDAKVAMVQPQFRTNVNVWINAYNNTVGENIEEVLKMRSARTAGGESISIKGGGPAPPSPKPAPVPKSPALSDDEKRIAKKLGLTDDEYRRGKDRYENQETSWDQVITFDSSRRRVNAAAAK